MTPAELKTWRERHNLLQAELAEMLGVFWLTISKWENGVQKIPPYLHLALAELARRIFETCEIGGASADEVGYLQD